MNDSHLVLLVLAAIDSNGVVVIDVHRADRGDQIGECLQRMDNPRIRLDFGRVQCGGRVVHGQDSSGVTTVTEPVRPHPTAM